MDIPRAGQPEVGSGAEAAPRSRPAAWSWARLGVLTAFWIHVTASNVLYAHGMSLSLDPHGVEHFFAPWRPRVLQHVLLYPSLIGCVFLSLHIGWRRPWRSVPLQILLALLFAFSASPLMDVAEYLLGPDHGTHAGSGWGASSIWRDTWQLSPENLPMHVASTTSFLLTYGFAIALITSFALYQRYRDSELRREALERAFTDARLAALRMQLSPHTLFNLLHTIRGNIDWNPAAAQSMIVQLGDLLRRLLAAGEREFSPLPTEIDFARLYLELQQRRFADRLRICLPQETPARSWVPSLILQPLIENAVVHGLAGHSGAVDVTLESRDTPGGLVLRVTNTVAPVAGGGTGLTPASARPRLLLDEGIGLRNVRERLRVLFGERAWLTTARGDECWVAELHLPALQDGRLPGGT